MGVLRSFIFLCVAWMLSLFLLLLGLSFLLLGQFWLSLTVFGLGIFSTIIAKDKPTNPSVKASISLISAIGSFIAIAILADTKGNSEQTQAQTSQTSQINQLAQIPNPIPAPPPEPIKYDLECKVVGVSDGDTLTCLKNKKQIKVRLDQIDAPEKNQDYGNVSKKTLSDLVHGQVVGLKTKEKDKYGRTVAEVYLGQKNINKSMVRTGMAWAYREYMSDQEYITLENQARTQSLGIWSQPNPIYPSQFRQEQRQKEGQEKVLKAEQKAREAQQRKKPSSGGGCGSKRYCKEMNTCAEARHYLNVCGLSRLDRDGDGVPCESLCR